MAIGQLSSLGIGSGVLNYDVIDKLKKADEKTIIAPIDRKMKENIEKQKELTEINTLISAFKSPISSLADYSTYLGRTSNVSNDAIKASVNAGIPLQDIKIDVESLAQGDINEVGVKFNSRDDVFSAKDIKLNLYVKGQYYTIDIKGGMTLNDVAQKITDTTNGEAMGIVMKTGGEKPYQLMINSKDTGEGSRIYFGSTLATESINSLPELGEGDFNLVVRDANANEHTISVMLDAKDAQAQNKPEALKNAILKALKENEFTKDLVGNELNVGISDDGKKLILNDRRGFSVKIEGNKLSEIGITPASSKEDGLFNTKNPIPAGQLEGSITIGSITMDLSKMTKKENTSQENAKILAQAIENIAGLHASSDGSGRLHITSEVGEVDIHANDAKGEEFLKDMGIKNGLIQNYIKLQEETFAFKNLQQGSDARFSYNGVGITRPTNEITDVIKGVNLTLVHPTEPDKPAIISVGRDTDAIKEKVKDFVKTYNELVPKLDEVTRFDKESKVAGIFNGVGDIRSIRPSINSIFSQSVGGNSAKSLVDFGLSIDEKSRMTLNEGALDTALTQDPQKVVETFYGYDSTNRFGRDEHVDGIFVKFNTYLKSLVDGSNASLNLFQDSLTKDAKNLEKDKIQANERLKTHYDTMANRFAAYDEQIAQANNSFNAVQMMIDQSTGAANKKK
ncbi:flagellar filament capping protein FliD [Helicobacter mustelae]|uniref:flagellar filament capping protein FliD n=1 Tax=Helicobacter mustelae TaxID=217 RepID=UPI0003080379|nr:flagellar filament capping protein FliD [Helicobacter mustelae]SQH71157.1 flagellar hook-associated protein [Helicobacter mustelae]STP12285.1 flagellar hook-associated protein [Helicobacter mustelae]